ncbi:MAG: DNA primase DnaG [Candidatus Pacearchaeota archaeon]
MGKVSPPSIKYIIYATFTAEGVVEKPDVIGAIFGQSEGLLGEELELRELQKKGKIGRIDATLEVSDSKTTGTVEIPTSIDRAETTIIAAAIETIDRIGPCDAKFEIKSIEDVRSSKREYIVERAKKLMEKFQRGAPELREMQQDIMSHARVAKVREYGKELLAAGPDIEVSSEIIVVEGRADVMNLLRAGIKNVIAMNGTSMPQTIKDLSKEKQVTLFLDGDRGGLLIAKDALATTQVVAIARAPDGKEVEELTEKEIVTCLRNRMTVEEFKDKYLKTEKTEGTYQTYRTERTSRTDMGEQRSRRRNYRKRREQREIEPLALAKIEVSDETLEKNLANLQELLFEIDGTKSALILGPNGEIGEFKVLRRVSASELPRALLRTSEAIGLVIDGTATLTIIRAAEKRGCKFIVAKNFTTISRTLKLISF